MSCQTSNEERRAELTSWTDVCAMWKLLSFLGVAPTWLRGSQHSGTPPNTAAVDYGEEVVEDPRIRSRRPPYMVQFPG